MSAVPVYNAAPVCCAYSLPVLDVLLLCWWCMPVVDCMLHISCLYVLLLMKGALQGGHAYKLPCQGFARFMPEHLKASVAEASHTPISSSVISASQISIGTDCRGTAGQENWRHRPSICAETSQTR